jgi:hypothetical protein
VRRQKASPDLGVANLIVKDCEDELRQYQQHRAPMKRNSEVLVSRARWVLALRRRDRCIHHGYSKLTAVFVRLRKRDTLLR